MNVILLGTGILGKSVECYLQSSQETIIKPQSFDKEYDFNFWNQGEIIISAGWPALLNKDIIYNHYCINIHLAYLPYNRGKRPIFWAIVDGTPAGATIHVIDTGIDSGPILCQREVEVSINDDEHSLWQKSTDAAIQLFVDNWSKIKTHVIRPIPQNVSIGTYHNLKDYINYSTIENIT